MIKVLLLADDLETLETRSSMLRTPEILSQTNNSIHKHSSIRCKGKSQEKRSKLKVQLKSVDLQKNQSNRSYETQTTIERSLNSNILETKF